MHEIYSHGTAAKHVLHVSAQRGFSPLYNSAAGAPCSVPELDSEVPPPPSFPANLPHNNTQMSQGAAEGRGGVGDGVMV